LHLGELDFDRHPLSVGQCSACSLLQLVNFMPSMMVKPRFDWIKYNEPEKHLDLLLERVIQLPGISGKSLIGGLTYENDTSITRLKRLWLYKFISAGSRF